ncbi:adenylate cyclase-like protein [Daedalea quercina L-15889]|uniref:Adenylate cyclase n=1 Tax=Daedalea quercina L-15889 TaxID=1314783 RepID=A0A165KWN7_9APHY|nr:adenylate cyclase-like protein [Daedalea quercina L-15889]
MDDSPSWTAPESWAVEKEGEEPTPVAAESSEEDETVAAAGARAKRKRRHRTTLSTIGRPTQQPTKYKIRIYRANGTYHVVACELSVTVAQLIPELNKKLSLNPDREPHSLYLKERGRERVLALTEKPASIVRRRLEQAGYDEADELELLGADDLAFLMKFEYKSNVLGPVADDFHVDTFDLIDLTGRSLRTVPVLLYPHADAIVSLNLSRNPMLEIPLDFIQACTTLRELRLSHMAMKKVPQSIRHCTTLHRLDLSCNRIADLDDAALDRIPELRSLKVQNNRMEKLPWYFPRLRHLKDLNVSNNKFRTLPAVVTQLTKLVDLDISFNMLEKLPEDIGQLEALEHLIIVGNQVSEFPATCSRLTNLKMLDCRRNHITDLATMTALPKVEQVFADHNAVHALDLSFGSSLKQLDASHNDITQLTVLPGPIGQPYALTSLDISHAKLSALDERALAQLTALETLRIDHNTIRYIPDTLGSLTHLVHLSCSNNQLRALPSNIGNLQRLETLEVHNNSLGELPATLWNCASLRQINATSNLLGSWRVAPVHNAAHTASLASQNAADGDPASLPPRSVSLPDRKVSASSGSTSCSRALPPIVYTLERLYLGENRLTDENLQVVSLLQELRVLNLSFNDIQEMPASFFRNMTSLEELYLSGNKLSAVPTEDLHRLTKLQVMFLNGNKLQTLPQELGKLTSLTVLDVGNNILKYNIFNWEFDWNWNFNKNLQYLNLSGNKRLEIRTDIGHIKDDEKRKVLADFSGLTQLRVLGLIDITATNGALIPDENEDRRVRTSLSEVNGMAYGIADTLGVTEHLNMLDLVQPNFRNSDDEAIFAMFGRSSHIGNDHHINSYLRNRFVEVYSSEMDRLQPEKWEDISYALRRAFLKLNRFLHDYLYSTATGRKMSHVSASNAVREIINKRSGASGIVLHLDGRTLWVANVGRSLAVISRAGEAELLSRCHDPFDRVETHRIRMAEGWVSPKGAVNDEIDVSRSFGFYNLLPVVNAKPDVTKRELTEQDEFVIVGNAGLWDNVSYQTAVDIARTERSDPMIAAQKLRDLAISHGADGTTMIMVIAVADLFKGQARSRQPTMESIIDTDVYLTSKRRRKDENINNRDLTRLDQEIPAPVGHLALVFTDIRNSTHLWEVNAGMPTAIAMHNQLLRRQLRRCGGYEVKTEGDAFMCSFPTALAAVWFCFSVQMQLLQVDWPLEILECEDGKEIYDQNGKLVARGLSVRMGIHCGTPFCEPDPITERMDYFGPMVNRAARIEGAAAGGQIMCSADVVREINARILDTEPHTEHSHRQPSQAIDALRGFGVVVGPVGQVKLKGLEVPETLSLIYPRDLSGRQSIALAQTDASPSASRVQFSVNQMREMGMLCVRLEMLSSGRALRASTTSDSTAGAGASGSETSPSHNFDPKALLPIMDKASDADLMFLLDSLATRIENALTRISLARLGALQHQLPPGGIDREWLSQLLAVISPLPSLV